MANQKSRVKDIEKKGFQSILFKYLPFWPLFAALLLVCVGGLFVFLHFSNPVFETTASILIKDQAKGEEDSKMEEVLNLFGTKKVVENETEVLKSNEIVGTVVDRLKLYAPVLEEKGWRGLASRSAYYSSPILVEAQEPAKLKSSTSKQYFTYDATTNTVTTHGKAYPVDQWVNTPDGVLRFLKNPYQNAEAVKRLAQNKLFYMLLDQNTAIKNISASLLVTPVSRQSSVINLKIRDEIPQRGELILRELVDVYNDAAIERKNGIASKTLRFIEERLKHVSRELDSVDAGIQRYRAKNGVVDISEQGRLYLQTVQQNDQELNRAKIQQQVLDDVEKHITSKDNQSSISPATMTGTDPALNQLLDKLTTSQAQYEKLKKTTAENNPVLSSIQNEITKTRSDIMENVRSQRRALETSVSSLSAQSNKYSGMLGSIPQKERLLLDVSRQKSIKSDIYSFLLQKKEETAYSISAALPDCFMVDNPASSLYPVSPKKPLLGLFALILPFVFGVLIINLKEAMNNKVMYRSSIEKMSKFPVIGEIIHNTADSPIVFKNAERNFITEQFRQIRSALKHQGNPPGNFKRMLVTSSVKGEGKSFIACNLALSLAKSGKKVALVELDLHQPKLSSMLNYTGETGITDFLNRMAKIDDITIPSGIDPNLFIIPAGGQVEEPSELLLNGRLEEMLNQLDTKFDLIVVDTAPVKAITDAFTIAPLCNLVLYVVRHDYTLKTHIEMLDEDMESFQIDKVAIIFNGVKKRGFSNTSYGYGYGYGYSMKSSYDGYYKKKKNFAA